MRIIKKRIKNKIDCNFILIEEFLTMVISQFNNSKPIEIPRKRNVVRDDTDDIWKKLCSTHNRYAIKILEDNMAKIDWSLLSANPYALHLLEKYPHRVNWFSLLSNPNKNVINLIEPFVL